MSWLDVRTGTQGYKKPTKPTKEHNAGPQPLFQSHYGDRSYQRPACSKHLCERPGHALGCRILSNIHLDIVVLHFFPSLQPVSNGRRMILNADIHRTTHLFYPVIFRRIALGLGPSQRNNACTWIPVIDPTSKRTCCMDSQHGSKFESRSHHRLTRTI